MIIDAQIVGWRHMQLLLLATSGLLFCAKFEDRREMHVDNRVEHRLGIWLDVLDLRTAPHVGTSGWFTYDISDQKLHRKKRLAQGQVLSVARNVPIACAVVKTFAGHGYSTTVILYCVESGGEIQRIELPVRTASGTVAALSDDGARLAIAYVGAPDAARPEQSPVSAWHSRLDLYRCSKGQIVLEKTGPWPKQMKVRVDDAIKWLQWAPDGKSLICEQDRQIWRIAADLTEAQNLGLGKGACFSPEGQLLAIADWQGVLVVQDIQGKIVLKRACDIHNGGMAWLDNQRIAFVEREYPVLGKALARLCILDLSTQEIAKTQVVAHNISVVGVGEFRGEQ